MGSSETSESEAWSLPQQPWFNETSGTLLNDTARPAIEGTWAALAGVGVGGNLLVAGAFLIRPWNRTPLQVDRVIGLLALTGLATTLSSLPTHLYSASVALVVTDNTAHPSFAATSAPYEPGVVAPCVIDVSNAPHLFQHDTTFPGKQLYKSTQRSVNTQTTCENSLSLLDGEEEKSIKSGQELQKMMGCTALRDNSVEFLLY
ncbi:hypothetical protein E2C01_040671 [Portunus trituberculatus]|uniref:Uncharacterized protein n=1 Tax=Portunus trituberculatus TaxID=210409 RepID=A0A5B7FHA7_PORTR|nr:hypothetical protein [Portunus trituberculatus]